MAAAVFGDPKAVKFTPLTAKERFTALQSGEIDMLSRNTTWTMSRDTSLGLTFAGTSYYDGQGFMIRKSLGVTSALRTRRRLGLRADRHDDRAQHGRLLQAQQHAVQPGGLRAAGREVNAAYESGRCDAYTTDASGLYAIRLTLTNPDDHIVLPEIISKEPLGPVVRQGDDQWFNIVKWTHFALLNAEELGVTSKNVDEMKNSDNQKVRRLLGTDGTFGEMIGLSNDWAYNIIKAVGNYGEIFDRNIGADSPLQDCSWPEQALVDHEGRHPVRAADPLISPNFIFGGRAGQRSARLGIGRPAKPVPPGGGEDGGSRRCGESCRTSVRR